MDSKDAWRELAECSDTWGAINWYPEDDQTEDIEAAKAVCAVCPVRNTCLEDAMASERDVRIDTHGIRGGMTARERRKLNKALRGPRAKKTA